MASYIPYAPLSPYTEKKELPKAFQKNCNLQAPWLGFTAFLSLAIMLSLLVFIGEALRDAFDPRKTFSAEDQS